MEVQEVNMALWWGKLLELSTVEGRDGEDRRTLSCSYGKVVRLELEVRWRQLMIVS